MWQLSVSDEIVQSEKIASLVHERHLMGGAVFRDTIVVAGGKQ